ncbi:MAG: hypothetical protein Q8L64_04790 [bacterium]|nr:hypothetical protein [bacterium]
MTYEEYRNFKHETPYILRIKTPKSRLFYFGERHSFDPASEQWRVSKELWAEFLADKSPLKIALVEGGRRKSFATEKESIEHDGGMGLVTFLATQNGIETASPEPSEAFERAEIEKRGFSRDEIQYYFFARVVHQWVRKLDPKPDFDFYMNWSLKADEMSSGWTGYDFSLDHMKMIHEKLFSKPFSIEEKGLFFETTNPTDEKRNRINQVSIASGEVRNLYIIERIAEYLNDGYSVFAQWKIR